jgi:hypothetical protein
MSLFAPAVLRAGDLLNGALQVIRSAQTLNPRFPSF